MKYSSILIVKKTDIGTHTSIRFCQSYKQEKYDDREYRP